MPPILYTRAARLDLNDYGILVPLKGSRPDRVREALAAAFGPGEAAGWAGVVDTSRLTAADLMRVHTKAYCDLILSPDPVAAIEACYELFDASGQPNRYAPQTATRPMSDLVQRALVEATGTLAACEVALEEGFCHFLGGGMHHAMAGEGRGFCLIHDVCIALRRLMATQTIKTAWVIDTDCHRGDGTAALTIADDNISTLSIHMANGWPIDGSPLDEDGQLRPCFWPSTVDRGVPVGGEADYLPLLQSGLDELEKVAAAPDLVVVVAGSDPSDLDVLASADGLKLSLDQMLERDLMVYDFLRSRGVAQAWVMAGGYGDDVWQVHAGFLKRVVGDRAFIF